MDKFILQPVTPFRVNQKFGENNSCVSTDGSNKVISCNGSTPPEGYTSLYGPKGHLGVDLKAYHGQSVYCAFDGVINFIDTQPRTGLDVRVVSEYKGEQYMHIYEHLLGYNFKVGQPIKTGDSIGWADNTGYSSGDHLHFQLNKKVNGLWIPIDPLPLMLDYCARDVTLVKSLLEKYITLLETYIDWLRGVKKPINN